MVRKKSFQLLPRLLSSREESYPFSRKGERRGREKNWAKELFFLSPPRCLSQLENGDQASLVKQSNLASILLFPVWLRSKDSSFPSAKTTSLSIFRKIWSNQRDEEWRRREGKRNSKRHEGEERRRVAVDKGRRADFNNAVWGRAQRRENRGREFARKTKTKWQSPLCTRSRAAKKKKKKIKEKRKRRREKRGEEKRFFGPCPNPSLRDTKIARALRC